MHGGNQCRIRHIKAIVGRNIGWVSNNNIQEITEVPNLSSHTDTSNTPSPSTSTTIITPPTNNNITFTSTDNNNNNNSNSNNTASITKRFSNSSSKQNQYNNGNIDNNFNNTVTTTTPSHIHKLDTHHNLQLKDTNNSQSHMMQRSDSTSSMQSCNSSVADSSLTKSAYKNSSKRLENKTSTIFNISSNNNNNNSNSNSSNNNNNNINMNDSYSVSTIDDDFPSKHEKELLDTYLTLSLPILPHYNPNDIHDTNSNQKDNNDEHNECIDTDNGSSNFNNNIHPDAYQTKKIKDTTFTNINVNNILERPLYTSEIIPNSTNPLFRTDMSMIDWYDGVQTVVIAKIWARHSIPESASLSKQMDPTRIQTSHLYSTTTHHEKSSSDNNNNNNKHSYSLIVEWVVDMNELIFVGKSLKHAYSWPNNTLLFKLENGYYTSPDIASVALGQSKRPIYLDSNLDIDNASLHSIQSPRIKRSYTYHHIMKLNTLKDCIFDAKKAADEVQQNINDLLEQEKEKFRLLRLRSQKETRLKELENEIQEQRQNMKIGNRKIEDFRNTLERRKLELKRSQERFHREKEDLESNEIQLENNVKMHHDVFTKLNQRKKELIADLFSIYPIEQSFDDFQQFRIRGIYLPNSVYTGCNEESIATALGFTAHLVNMMAFYLDIPLRYPIDPMGSRSLIHDPVSLINGSRVFPLYGKGVDKYRFEFGVFLLNKNIEQMMNAYGLIVMDLRHTLPNIHYFIQAVLTTSVTSGPTSLSVLSISSYAQGKDIFEGTATRIQPSRSIDLTSTIKKMNSSSSLANNKSNKNNNNNHRHYLQHKNKKYSNSGGYNHLKNNNDNDNDNDNDDNDEDEDEEEHGENHLTLQPTIFIPTGPTPSPTISTQSVSISPKFGVSPGNGYPYTGVHLSSSVISVPAYLDTVTTSSCQKKPISKT